MSDADRWWRVEELCHAALEREASERSAFLTTACGDDQALRCEVEALLAHAQTAEGFLSAPIGAVAQQVLGSADGAELIGRRIGVYEIRSRLGAGGMGEVYRARDSRLGRDVAIKVLPPTFLADRERLARFEREARVLATLNHPNIGAIYGLEEVDTVPVLILELVEGQTLAERIADSTRRHAGGIPIVDALSIARQITNGLEAAHEKGIVHRDLKPANIKITPAGEVKVLDFGLAKAGTAPGRASADFTRSPTITIDGTGEGTLLGTVAYMSPEQARGQAVDKRTDVWAFGCVLFEMLTGRATFAGQTVADHVAAILERDPDWTLLPEAPPAAIRRLLRRCLEKDPGRRLHDIADARIEIDEATGAPLDSVAVAVPAGHGAGRSLPPWVLVIAGAACAGLGALVIWVAASHRSQPERLTTRSTVTLPSTVTIRESIAPSVALSPDGRLVAFAASIGGRSKIYLRPIEAPDAMPLAGTDGPDVGTETAKAPAFSADSQWLAFAVGGMLKKIAVSGGAPQSLVPAPGLKSLTWADDGRIVFNSVADPGLVAVTASGGNQQTLTKLDIAAGDKTHRAAEMLPGGKVLLMSVGTADMASFDDARIEAVVLATGQRKVLVRGGMQPRYLQTGHLVYARAGTLLAVPFNLDRLEVAGTPVVVANDVDCDSVWGYANFATSRDGSLIYLPGGANARASSLVWIDRRGQSEVAVDIDRNISQLRISPDGRRVALARDTGNTEIWVYDLLRSTWSRLAHGWDNYTPIWSADGLRITFSSNRPHAAGDSSIYSQSADGTGDATPLPGDVAGFAEEWSSGDCDLLFTARTFRGSDSALSLWSMEDHAVRPLADPRSRDSNGRLSPDGRWVAYQSDRTGHDEVYVQRFPGPSPAWLVSVSGGASPSWSHDGRELFFRNGARMMVADVKSSAEFSAGRPRLLFEAPDLNLEDHTYDVARDGRFLMIRHQPRIATQINLVQNWFAELNTQARRQER